MQPWRSSGAAVHRREEGAQNCSTGNWRMDWREGRAKCWVRLSGKEWKLCQWRLDQVVSGAVQVELILPQGWARPPEVPSKADFYAL